MYMCIFYAYHMYMSIILYVYICIYIFQFFLVKKTLYINKFENRQL